MSVSHQETNYDKTNFVDRLHLLAMALSPLACAIGKKKPIFLGYIPLLGNILTELFGPTVMIRDYDGGLQIEDQNGSLTQINPRDVRIKQSVKEGGGIGHYIHQHPRGHYQYCNGTLFRHHLSSNGHGPNNAFIYAREPRKIESKFH